TPESRCMKVGSSLRTTSAALPSPAASKRSRRRTLHHAKKWWFVQETRWPGPSTFQPCSTTGPSLERKGRPKRRHAGDHWIYTAKATSRMHWRYWTTFPLGRERQPP